MNADPRRPWAPHDYRGPLVHPAITPAGVAYTGKESEHFEAVEEGLAELLAPDGVVQVFGAVEAPAADFTRDVLPVLRTATLARVTRESGVPLGTIEGYTRRGRLPRPQHRAPVTVWAYTYAGACLVGYGIEPATDAARRFAQYREHAPAGLTCQAPGCGKPLPQGRRVGCCDRHTRSAKRAMQAAVKRTADESFPQGKQPPTGGAT